MKTPSAPKLNGKRPNGAAPKSAIRNPQSAIPLPPPKPVFDAENVELQRRMRFNPLRTLDPENLSLALDQFDIGILRQAALLWDAMCRRDDTLSFVKPQFESSIAGKPWGIFKRPDADPVEAARHARCLDYFYSNLTATDAFDRNERGDKHLLLRQMGSAYATKYAVHHFIWEPKPGQMLAVEEVDLDGRKILPKAVPAITATLEFVPLWFFENVSGRLRFLPFGGFGVSGQDLDWEMEWMSTTGTGIMFAASICYVFKRLTFQDWTIYNERYSNNKVVGMTDAQKDSDKGRAMANIVGNFNGDQGIVLYECQATDTPPISLLGPEGATSVDLFERFLERQDRKLTVMFRGSDLRNMSRQKDTVGVSAQSEETDAMELAHCAQIAGACRDIDRRVIAACFGADVQPLAYFGLPDMDDENAQEFRENAGFLADRGVLVDAQDAAERLGVTITADETEALTPVSMPTATGDTKEAQKITTANARSREASRLKKERRLEKLITEALKNS